MVGARNQAGVDMRSALDLLDAMFVRQPFLLEQHDILPFLSDTAVAFADIELKRDMDLQRKSALVLLTH